MKCLQPQKSAYKNVPSATRQVTGNPDADTVTFKYDPFGRRIEKNVSTYENGVSTTYKYTYLKVLVVTQSGPLKQTSPFSK